ncbi:transmembrane protein 245-like [Oppia nitens]|uniref:transmembrane protein 245-like n=1 Tax=Oppia nitens TaxID=1686743 RepID=UPI0023DABFD8|nr:transmembrane protein 245-like [Oppia nitens]
MSSSERPLYRSPLVSSLSTPEVFHTFITNHEKGLKDGFYNSIALIFLMFVVIVIYNCYWILQPFLRPLVWAILCGSALHPFKRQLQLCSQKWITDLKSDGKPITLGTLCLPLIIINSGLDVIIVLIHVISLFGTSGQILFLLFISIIIIGLLKTLITGQSISGSNDQTDGLVDMSIKLKNIFNSMIVSFNNFIRYKDTEEPNEEIEDKSGENVSNDEIKMYKSVATSPQNWSEVSNESISRRSSNVSNKSYTKNQSNTYLCTVLWAVVFVQLWSHRSIIYLVLIPIVFKSLIIFSSYLSSLLFEEKDRLIRYIEKKSEVIFTPFIQRLWNYFKIGDKLIMDLIEASLNSLTSLSVICLTVISILFIGIFISIQIYGESLQLVNLMGNIFNKTISYYPEATQLLPESIKGVDGMLDQMVKNGYEYGRQYIKNSIRNTLDVDSNVTQSKAVEKQILEIWDRAYHLWLIRNTNETNSVPKKGPYEFDKLYNAFKTLNLNLVFNIVKENIDTLISIFESVWLLLKGNISLLFTALAAVFSTLLGGGLGLMNLVLSFIIFTTALFYLLSASGEYYKPVELVNRIFPSEVTSQEVSVSSNNKLGRAVEEAINGVFTASLKMSAFYGLYTWLTHRLFDANIVYIPSVMAATFGAIPFLSAFWASFPAFLDLFFVQNETTKAVLLLIVAYTPSFFVDSTIYSEIKSAGHPYLTGLAIAGGVFYLGFEGALIGPILLCCLFVAFNIYSSIMQESTAPTATTGHSHSHKRDLFKRMLSQN